MREQLSFLQVSHFRHALESELSISHSCNCGSHRTDGLEIVKMDDGQEDGLGRGR